MGDPGEGALRELVVLEHLLIRGFAAATVIAVAAAVLTAGSVAVFAVGSVEAVGLTAGRTAIDIVDLPFGPDKSEHISMLSETAEQHGVDLALVTPDQTGRPAEYDIYVLNGAFEHPTFWARSTQHPSSDIGDAVITWTYAVDGEPGDILAMQRALRAAGFEHFDAGVRLGGLVLAAFASPGITGVVLAALAAALIALVAESRHRLARTRVRLLSGWSRRALAAREAVDVLTLLGACAAPLIVALVVFVGARGASPAVTQLLTVIIAALVGGVVIVFAGAHVLFTQVAGRLGVRASDTSSRSAIVAIIGVSLVACITVTGVSVVDASRAGRELERRLAAEAAAGDDVTLGVGFSSQAQETALGLVGAEALRRGTARMAMTNFMQDALLIAGDDLPGAAQQDGDGATILVPKRFAGDALRIRSAVEEAFAEAWELDDASPQRRVPVSVEIVPTTEELVRSAERWVVWGLPRSETAADMPVIVLHTVEDLAPNRVSLAVHNSEVRFSDRDALVSKLRETRAIDVVTQINRVGDTIARELSAVRAARSSLAGAGSLLGLASFLAAVQLAADHQRRTEVARRSLHVVGRRAASMHALFVAGCAGIAGATSFIAMLAVSSTLDLMSLTLATVSAACVAGVFLVAGLLLTSRRRAASRPPASIRQPRDRIAR